MSDYKQRVKEEAKAFYEQARKEFAEDAEDHGGRSEQPNLAMWIDQKGKLSARIEEICSKWTHKDFLWVQTNTRSRPPVGGGDPRSNAFASFLQDVRHEIKKLAKAGKGA